MKESDYPALYVAADAASKSYQRSFLLALGGNLTCLCVAAVLSVVDAKTVWFSILQAGVLLVSVALTIFLAAKQPQRLWYGTRALAESVKTVSWRFMLRAEPFEANDAEARTHFVSSLRKIFEANQQISAHAVEMQQGQQITNEMLRNRGLDLEQRRLLYSARRIDEQHVWYIGKARQNAKASKIWFGLVIASNAGAIIAALMRALFPDTGHWPTDIFIGASGSIMAWLQTKRYQELSGSYTLTAHEIGLLKETMPLNPDERTLSVFVADSENAFSREHTQWIARRDAD